MNNTKVSNSQTITTRSGEEEKLHYRSRRFFVANGEWYFDTREQTHVGPFSTEASAAKALGMYIKEITTANSSIELARARANNGLWSVTNYQ
jgi:hypothetical protein